MDLRTFKADILLLTTALLWGCAFVAQRAGMDHVGPHTFNAVRFALGALALLPLALRSTRYPQPASTVFSRPTPRTYLWGGAAAGSALFCGAALQQMGLVYTTAGKAGFITGLYVVFVPMLALALGKRQGAGIWIGAFLAVIGLYLLSVNEDFSMEYGDILQLVGAFFWAGHVLVIGWISPRVNPLLLSIAQYCACSALSLVAALLLEDILWDGIWDGAIPILYGGVVSVGIAYTLQVVAQRDAQPAHAAIILSLESVFAALAGWLLLDETMGGRAIMGCSLMLVGMLCAQLMPLLGHREPRR
jgi:drug/metabolite transporter (DMT)-like permease